MASIVSRDLFETMLPNRDRFYTYEAFVAAANAFPDFGNTGDMTTRKREIAAFFAQTSQETTEYRFVTEHTRSDYREPHAQWPPAPGKQYYGRGPIQLSWTYNYGQAGRDIGVDLLNNPDQVATNPVISFKTALWFWMTPQPPKPSCHDVIIGSWNPSASERAAGRVPGFGMTTNIINGGLECGQVSNIQQGRIEFFRRYCQMFGINPGYNLDCGNQRSYGY